MTTINIGNKIRELRKKKGITQDALACALSISPQAVSKWESGLTMPDVTIIPTIAGYFEVSLDVLFDYDVTKMKTNIQKIITDAHEYFYTEPLRYAKTMESALKDYPENEALLAAMIDAYEYDMRENGNTANVDCIIDTAQRIISISSDFLLVCSAKSLQASAYLKKNDYEKAKQILNTLPGPINHKYDEIAYLLKGKDKLNGAIRSRCDHLAGLYIACLSEGDAWFKMDECNETFSDCTPDDYIPEAIKAYKKGEEVIKTFLIEGMEGQDKYLWDGIQTFHWCFKQRLAACYKRLGNTKACEDEIKAAYHIIETSWSDFDEKHDEYMQPFNEYLLEYGLGEYVK